MRENNFPENAIVARGHDLVEGVAHFAHDSYQGLKSGMIGNGQQILSVVQSYDEPIQDPTSLVGRFQGVLKRACMVGFESALQFALWLIIALTAMMAFTSLLAKMAEKSSKNKEIAETPTHGIVCSQGCPTYEEWLAESKSEW